MTKRLWNGVPMVVAAVWLAGCASGIKLDETPVESRLGTPVGTRSATAGAAAGGVQGAAGGTRGNAASAVGGAAGGAAGGSAAQSQVATVNLANSGAVSRGTAPDDGVLGRVVYFDFDSFAVRDEFRTLVEGHARTLAANKGKRLLVEGHSDERGGREYNLALGQKRAESVVKALALLGASEAQLEAVSYGKERPAVEGHDEDAWARNRRAELKDR